MEDMRMLAGFEAPTAGTIEIDGRTVVDGDTGRDVPSAKRGAGLIF